MALVAHAVGFAYHAAHPVLRGLDAACPAGAFTVVVGPNGAGKSTLLRLLAGVRRPSAGRVTLDGTDLASLTSAQRAARTAYAPQRPEVVAPFTVEQVVALARFARPPHRRGVDRAIDELELAPLRHRLYGELSAGEQQRVALARTVAQLEDADATGPIRALIADEPCAPLDPRHALLALEVLHRRARRGCVVVCSLHDLALAARTADHAIVLDGAGRSAAAGPPAEALAPGTLERVFAVPFRQVPDGDAPPLLVTDPPGRYPSGTRGHPTASHLPP